MHEGKYSAKAVTYALKALSSDSSPLGEAWVPSFEGEFCKFAGSKYAISVNSATSGIHAALLAVGVGPGDEVISPALTVIMDAYATLFCGAVPVFADVDIETWNLDPKSVESLISPRTKAILTVSWFGLPSNLVALRDVADRYGIALIDDSAETMLLPSDQGKEWQLPDLRIFSFESKKHFTTGGEGGMVVTNSPLLAERVRKFAGIGYKHLAADKGRTHLAARVFQNPNYERFDTVGFNYRMTPISAAIGLGQLENIQVFLDARKRCADLYLEAIKGFPFLLPQRTSGNHSYYTFGVRFLADKVPGWNWQRFYDLFVENGGHGFYSNCVNPYLEPSLRASNFGRQALDPGLCPVAEKLQREIMAFKTNYMDIDSMVHQANVLRETCKMVANGA